MAEVMSMLPDEGGELTAEEQDSLAIGEQMQEAQDKRLAGKYENAEQLEAAYIELQKKLGTSDSSEETTEDSEPTEDEPDKETTDSSLFDRLWEEAQGQEFNENTIKELENASPAELAKMYLDYRVQNIKPRITEEMASGLRASVGGDQAYSNMMKWAGENLKEEEVNMYDSVMDLGDPNAAYFAMQALAFRYNDNVGYDGKLLQGKAGSESSKGYQSQAEVVAAMADPRYDRDPAYRQEVMKKLEASNVNF
jgi:hypothetical protein